jgi:hypothetical protein
MFLLTYTVKPVYKGHSKEPENVVIIYRLKLYAPFINGENELNFLAKNVELTKFNNLRILSGKMTLT